MITDVHSWFLNHKSYSCLFSSDILFSNYRQSDACNVNQLMGQRVCDSRLAFFELTFQFRTTQQLQWEVIRHYSKQVTFNLIPSTLPTHMWSCTLICCDVCVPQAIKQMYVLVLGLDVLGNPFGLIRGLSEGVEAFFYEPYQVRLYYY